MQDREVQNTAIVTGWLIKKNEYKIYQLKCSVSGEFWDNSSCGSFLSFRLN